MAGEAVERFGVIVSAIDKSRAGFASVLHGARELGDRMRSVLTAPLRALADPGSMALVYNLRALGGAFESLYAAQDEQRQANLKVSATLRATGYAAGFTADQLRAMADARQAVTTFDGDEIMNAQGLMLTFRNVQGETFKEGMRLAEDLASAFGQDLQGSVIQVGKALNDPVQGVSALGRVGVQFTEVQKRQIANFVETNRLASAQAVILDELRSQVGGVAEAMSAGAGGQLKQIRILMGDLVEGAANFLEPWAIAATGMLRGWLLDANRTMGEMVNGIRLRFDSIKTLAEETFSVVGQVIRSAFGVPGDMSDLEASVRGITRSVLAMAEGVMLSKIGGNVAAGTYQTMASWVRGGLGGALLRAGLNNSLNTLMDKTLGLSFRSLSFGLIETSSQSVQAATAHRRELERMKQQWRDLQNEIDRVMVKAGNAVQVTFADRIRDGLRKAGEQLRAFVNGAWTRATLSMSSTLSNWADRAAGAARNSIKAAQDVGQAWAEAANRLRSAISGREGAQREWANFAIGRREDRMQWDLLRAGDNPAAQNRIRFNQAQWLARQGGMWMDRPDMAGPMLEKAWGEIRNVRENFLRFGAGRGDWQQLEGLAGQVDQMQRQLLQRQLEAAQQEEKLARAKFDAEQRAVASAERRAKMDEQVAAGSAKLSQGFELLKGAVGKLVDRIGQNNGGQAQPQANAANAALDALLAMIW